MLRILCLLLFLVAPSWAVELRVATFNIETHRNTEGWPDYALGDPGTIDHDSVAEVLARIDADVVALQEVHTSDVNGSPSELEQLATTLGLPYIQVATNSGAFDTSLRVAILSRFPFHEAKDIVSPVGAKEITRPFPAVRVDVPGTDDDPLIISGHLKSGTGSDDRLRRVVEMERLVRYLADEGVLESDNFIVLGDFNPSGTNKTFTELPAGLPSTFVLGTDISLPLSYTTAMLDYFSSPLPVQLDPRQLNGSDGTYEYGQTLDLLFVSPAIASRTVASEIYRSSLDVSNGDGLPKAGSPLNDSTSSVASDHYAVFADLDLGEDVPELTLDGPWAVVGESFDGFTGLFDPAPWSMSGAVWLGVDDGSSTVPGARVYGSVMDGSVGHLPDQSTMLLETQILNDSGGTITMLDVSWQAEQWRSALAGSEDRIRVELEHGGAIVEIPSLTYLSHTDLPDGPVEGGVVALLSTRVHDLSVPHGDSFTLRFLFETGSGSGPLPDGVFVNELHYDNDSSDAGEFVEIVVGPGFAGALSDVALVLYNGSNGSAGDVHSLDGFALGETTASGHRVFSKMIAGLQNGAPDGFALTVDGVVSSFLSYEGSFLAADGPAVGMSSVDIGVSQSPSNPVGTDALGLTGAGGNAADFTWVEFGGISHSPGTVNDGQSLILTALPPQGIAVDDVSVVLVPDYDGDGLGDDEDLDDDDDGQEDGYELAFGSNPFDAASGFHPTLTGSAGALALSFPAAAGVAYVVEWSGDLSVWQNLSNHVGTGATIEASLPSGQDRVFVRVRAGE